MPQIPSTDSDSDEMSDTTLYTLVDFGGSIHDATLVTDLVTVSKKKKKSMAAGLNQTCLSEVHLEDITNMKGPFLSVRDDRGHETQVYDNKFEAQTPFYQLSGAEGLKKGILYWIRDVSPRLKQGDRVILVFLGCGDMDTADVVLDALNRRKYLTETEVIAAFPALPRDICIPLISETCCLIHG